jgi:DNA modification methylase
MDYKLINIPLQFKPAQEEVEQINQLLNHEELYIEPDNQGLKLFLNRADLKELRLHRDKLSSSLIDEIIASIEKIGSYGVKGGKRVFVGYNKERKVQNRKSKEKARVKHFYTMGHTYNNINTECPVEFQNQVITDDSEEMLKCLPDNCVDLVFTSPPYNFGLEYGTHPDDSFWKDYFDKLFRIFDQCIRVLKYGGRMVVNIQPLFSDYIPSHHLISNHFLNRKMIWKGEILWEKNNYNCKYTAWGSWKSPSNPYLKYTWEFLEVFCKGDLKKKGERDKIDIGVEEFKNWVVAKWAIAPESGMKKYGHPAMFPEELVKRVLKLFSYQDDLVLDPFNGAGTTTAVAQRLGRRFIGIDISEQYGKIARRRLNSDLSDR